MLKNTTLLSLELLIFFRIKYEKKGLPSRDTMSPGRSRMRRSITRFLWNLLLLKLRQLHNRFHLQLDLRRNPEGLILPFFAYSIEDSKHFSSSFHSFFQSIIRELSLGNFFSNLIFDQSSSSFFTVGGV